MTETEKTPTPAEAPAPPSASTTPAPEPSSAPSDPLEAAEFTKSLDPDGVFARTFGTSEEEEDLRNSPPEAAGSPEPAEPPESKPPAEGKAPEAKGDPASFLSPEMKEKFAQLPPDGQAAVREILANQQADYTRKTMDLAEQKKAYADLEALAQGPEDRVLLRYVAQQEDLRTHIGQLVTGYVQAQRDGKPFDPSAAFPAPAQPPAGKGDWKALRALAQAKGDAFPDAVLSDRAGPALEALSEATGCDAEDLKDMAVSNPGFLRALMNTQVQMREHMERVNQTMEPVTRLSKEAAAVEQARKAISQLVQDIPETDRQAFLAEVEAVVNEHREEWSKAGHEPRVQLALAQVKVEAKREAAKARSEGEAAAEAKARGKRQESLPPSGGKPAEKEDPFWDRYSKGGSFGNYFEEVR